MPPPPFPTGTVTFLFTDIEGSTRLWQDQPDAMPLVLARHDALLRDIIEAGGGCLVKTTGDGVFAAFATAPEALAAVLSAQRALQDEAWNLEEPLRVRMGLHTGVAELRDGDYYGSTLNRTARLMAAGHGGQALLSQATQELTRDRLPPAVSLRDMGERRLKDLARPERVFQLLHPALPADFPPLRSLDNPDLPNNLPQQVTSFVGRESEIAQIKAFLEGARLLTLAGTGGAGKSRLSLEVAADLLDQYFDGVWLVELAPLTDPSLVLQTVAAALGIKEQAGQTLTRTLTDALQPKRLLLVLDNCEHLVAACASLAADLLRGCPHVRILASSREPLNVAGEQVYRVPSLSRPDPKTALTVGALSQYEAVRLFIERAQAAQPAFTVTDANAPALAQVCWTLDGIPLALELAAARVRVLSVEQINERLNNRFRLLTGGDRAALPRQQTLRALIDWSHDLLAEGERLLLARLSVFAGGWSLEAAEAVCGSAPLEDVDVLDLLTSLVDKSLVLAEDDAGAVRYRMLETMRQYSAEKLTEAEAGAGASVSEHHRAFFTALAETAGPGLTGSGQAVWMNRLEAEHDNLRAAMDSGASGGTPEAALAGLRLAAMLWKFWYVRGYLGMGRALASRVIQGWQASRDPAGVAGADAAGNVLRGAGLLAVAQGDYAAARTSFEESLALFREVGDTLGMGKALGNLGHVAVVVGDHAAESLLREGLVLSRKIADKHGTAAMLGFQGLLVWRQGDYVQAQSRYEESLTLLREIGDKQGVASTLGNLGAIALAAGDRARGRRLYEESLGVCREIGHKLGIANMLNNMGDAAYLQRDYAQARMLLQEGLALYREMGDKHSMGEALGGLGCAALALRDYAQARASLEEGLTIFREIGDARGIAYVLNGMAALCLWSEEDARRAAELWGAADLLRESSGTVPSPQDREDDEGERVRARASLGEAAFAASWDAGRALTLDEAVALALEGPTPNTR